MSGRPRGLEEWCLVFTRKGGDVSVRAVGRLQGPGRVKRRQKFYQTTSLDLVKTSGRTITTRTGSVYSLAGRMSFGNAVLAGMPRKLLGAFMEGLPDDWFKKVAIEPGTPRTDALPAPKPDHLKLPGQTLDARPDPASCGLLSSQHNAEVNHTQEDNQSTEGNPKSIDQSASKAEAATPRPKSAVYDAQRRARRKRRRKSVVYTEEVDSAVKRVGFAENSKENNPNSADPGISWTKAQVAAYRRARSEIPSSTDNYWVRVAELVPGRSAEECVRYFEICYETPGRRRQQKVTLTPDAAEYLANHRKPGQLTAKYRQSIRTVANAVDKGYEDDIFTQEEACGSATESEPLKLDDVGNSPDLISLSVGDLATSVKRARRDAAAALNAKTPDVLARGKQTAMNDLDAYNAILRRNAAKAHAGTRAGKSSRKPKTPKTPAYTRRPYLQTPVGSEAPSLCDSAERDVYFS